MIQLALNLSPRTSGAIRLIALLSVFVLVLSAAPASAQTASSARFSLTLEEGAFFSTNGHAHLGIVSGGPSTSFTTTTAPIPTAPGFIGLYTVQSIPGDPINGAPLKGPGSSWQPAETLHFNYWRNADHSRGWDFGSTYTQWTSGMAVGQSSNTLAAPNANLFGTPGSFVISGPATNAITQVYVNTTPDVFVRLYTQTTTNATTGTLDVNDSNRFYTLEGNHWSRIAGGGENSLHLLLGVRYADLSDRLRIDTGTALAQTTTVAYETALGIPNSPDYTNTLNRTAGTSDMLQASNHFVAPQVGLSGASHWNRWWFEGDVKIAPGINFSSLNLTGLTSASTRTSTTPTTGITLAGIPLNVNSGAPPVVTTTNTNSPSGIFVQPANSGSHSRTVFAVMPAVSARFGYDFTSRLSAFVGSRFFLMSDVTGVSDAASAPATLQYGKRAYWAQSLGMGLRYHFR